MNNVTQGNKAIEGMIRGIKTVTQAIRPTYGHNGINVVIEDTRYPYHQIANDAQTIIQAIHVTDPVEKRGVGFSKELSDKQNSMSGDGRKTTCIIYETILDEGYKSELKGLSLKRELDSLIPVIESKIDEYKKEIDEDEVSKVATIAGESESIGKLIGSIYQKIGKDGVINVEGSGTWTDDVSYINGVRFHDTGFLTPYMAHDEVAKKEGRQEKRAIYENPSVLVTRQKITTLNDIDPLIQKLMEMNKKELVIFADDMDSGIASMLINTHIGGIFNILIIKAPTLWKGYVFEDFAKVTGSTIIDELSGTSLDQLDLDYLGTCGKIIVDRDETIVIGISDIAEHLEDLKKDGSNDSKLRLHWLNTKTATLKLGANNESELSYRRLKCEDAINSSRLALQDGVIEGGGITLYKVSKELPYTVAGQILAKALRAPIEQICLNSGLYTEEWNVPIEYIGAIEYKGVKPEKSIIYNELPNSWGENVLDASLVTKNAIRNAISLASTVLTTGIVITLPEKPLETLKDKQIKF